MVLEPSSLPFEVGDVQWMNDYGWAILALVGAFTFSLYLWSYLRKNFEIWKAHEGRYFDSEVLDYARKMALVFIVALMAIALYVVVSLTLRLVDDPLWPTVTINVFKVLAIIIVLLVARLIVLVLGRVARRSRGNANANKAMPSAVEFSSLLLSYVVNVGSAILVILIVVSMFIRLDTVWSGIGDFLTVHEWDIVVMVAIIVVIYFVIRLERTILEDVKFRSKKFNPQVIDLMESAIKYALLIIGFLVVLYILFWMIGMETLGTLLVVVTLVFLSLAIVLSYTTIQNIFSGLALMDSSPFDVGERISVDNMMCDVLEKGLVFTKVRTLDGEIVDIPNNQVIHGRIFNYSRAENHAITVSFEVSFKISHEEVESYVKEALTGIEGVLKDPKPEIRAVEFRGHNIVYQVVVFSKDVQRDPQLRSKLITRIQDIFQTEGHKTMVG